MKSPQAKCVRLLQERHQENLEIMLKNLLKDETLSDVTIHCRDGAVRAHRVILAASSPYFKKVFEDHPEHKVALLIHGVPIKQIKSLIELIYRGSTQIPSDMTSKLCDIAEEFGMKGIVDENDKSLLNASVRDTRFRGQKRVTVDFENDSSDTQLIRSSSPPKVTKNIGERRVSGCSSDKSFKKSPEILVSNPYASTPLPSIPTLDSLGLVPSAIKQEPHSPSTPTTTVSLLLPSVPLSAEARRRNNWAMKQRKYKCSLCPASFKRASHLSRHQLVHTGERPYACDQCDKAFSRHDKLKHHIRKAHHLEYMANIMLESSAESDIYTIGHVEMDTPHTDLCEEPSRITREDLLARMSMSVKEEVEPKPEAEPEIPTPTMSVAEPDLKPADPVCDEMDDGGGAVEESAEASASATVSVSTGSQQKKGRGRPRKYPPVPRPLIKRPRGRPRLSQTVPPVRPSAFKPSQVERRNDNNYDITNMPFGDLEYLTKPLHMEQNSENFEESNNTIEPNVMEPLVQIELDHQNREDTSGKLKDVELPEREENINTGSPHNTAGSFLQNIGLLETSSLAKMEIGECTISVSNGPGFS